MPALDELIGELRGEGEVDSRGRFTLDPAKAREKMRRFQLADPRRYVLELVQAAQLRGATQIDFTIDADDMWMRFDGRPFAADELSNLYSSLFADGEDDDDLRALRQLALGVNAAMGMTPKRARVESGEVGLELRIDDVDAIEERGPSDGMTVVHVKQRLRPRIFLDFFRKLVGLLGEERHITDRCAYAGITITLNGETIADGRREIGDAMAWVPLEGMDYAGSAAYVIGSQAELRLLKDGVWISSHRLEGEIYGLVVVIEDARLRKDVSQAKIVEDAAFQRAVKVCADARWRVLDELFDRYAGAEGAKSSTMGWLWRDALELYADVDGLRSVPVLRKIAGRVTWPSARGPERSISLLELVQSYDAQGQIRYGRRRYQELPEAELPTPVITDSEDLLWLRRVFGEDVIQRADLNRELRRIKGEAIFRARKVAAELGAQAQCIAKVRLRGRFRGEIGLRDSMNESVLWLIKEGCLLSTLEVNLPMRGVFAAVEGDFQANEFFDDVVRDEAFAEAILELLGSASDLLDCAFIEAERAGLTSDRGRRIVGLIKRYLAAISNEDSALIILRRLGYGKRSRELKGVVGGRLLPRLGIGRCEGTVPHALTKARLFPTLDGGKRSLLEIADLLREEGVIRYVGRGLLNPTATEGLILVLGRGDWRIVAGIFGEKVLEDNRTRVLESARESDFMSKLPFDVSEEFRFRTQVALPVGRVEALTPLLTESFDDDEGCSGFVGLAPNFVDDSIPRVMDGCVTRLILRGRVLCQYVFEVGVGPCFGVVADDRFTPGPSWDEVIDDRALRVARALVVRALERILGRLCEAYTELPVTDRRWATRILLHVAASAVGEGSVTPPRAVQDLRLIEVLSGHTISLEQLSQRLAKDGVIEYVRAGRFSLRADEPVVVLEDPERADLEVIFGADKLVDASPRLTQGSYAEGLRARPRAPAKPSIPGDEVLCADEMRGDGAAGVIALPLETTPGLTLDLCSLGRHVGTYRIPGGPPLRAFFIDPKLPLTAASEADLESERVAQIARWCRRRIPALIALAAARWRDLSFDEQRALRTHMRPFFVDPAAREGRRARVGWDAIRALPLFLGADGEVYSVEDLEKRGRARPLRWISEPVAEPRVGKNLVLILSEEERACLGGLFTLENYEELLARERELLASGARLLVLEAPEGALISRRSVAAGGMQCLLWLPGEFREDLELDFGIDGLVFASTSVSPAMQCAGAVTCIDPCAVDAFEPRQLTSLTKQVAGLYESLAARLASGRLPKSARPLAIRYLWRVQAALEGDGTASLVKWRTRLLDRLAGALPPLRVDDGKGKGRTRPNTSELRANTDVKGDGDPDDYLLPSQMRLASEDDDDDASPKDRALRLSPSFAVTRGTEIPDVGRGDAVAEFQAMESEDPAGEVLLRALVVQLRLGRVHRVGLLSDLNLSRISLGASRSPAIAESTEHGLVVNRRHALVAAALAELEASGAVSTMLLGALASGVYTVVNWQAEAVTDDDERRFLTELAAFLGTA